MTARGFVSIVGAGPGDPDLLTRRGFNRLRAADVVIHDGLVPAAMARLATSAHIERLSRRRNGSGEDPAAAVARMKQAAEEGARVVRLRAGDPFVLARGAEEALGLAAAGVPFEIVPGLTTASAAPAFAGIPLTHRGASSAVVIVSGHATDAYGAVLGSLVPHTATIVVLMGLAHRARIAALLLQRGWRPATRAAVVIEAYQPGGCVRIGSLRELAQTNDVAPGAPGVIVIGDTVAVGELLRAATPCSLVTSTSTDEEARWPQ